MLGSKFYMISLDNLRDFVQRIAEPGDVAISYPDCMGRKFFYFCTESNIGPKIEKPVWRYLSDDTLEWFEAQREHEFKVGDKVITSTGQTGVIESFCDCDLCAERGFLEPQVKTDSGVGHIYITETDKRSGFRNFYSIGAHKYGNIDIEDVEAEITSSIQAIESSLEMLKGYLTQLNTLHHLEK